MLSASVLRAMHGKYLVPGKFILEECEMSTHLTALQGLPK